MVDTAGSVKAGLHEAAERRAEEEKHAAEEEAARRSREKEKALLHKQKHEGMVAGIIQGRVERIGGGAW